MTTWPPAGTSGGGRFVGAAGQQTVQAFVVSGTVDATNTGGAYGAWSLVSVAFPWDGYIVGVVLGRGPNGSVMTLVDVGVGGIGSESVVATSAGSGGASVAPGLAPIPVPPYVASGARVSARVAVTTGGLGTPNYEVVVLAVPASALAG